MQNQDPIVTRAMTRRRFAGGALLAAVALSADDLRAATSSPPGGKWKAAIIGYTGEGDYGHGHELIFNGRANIEVVGLADPDPAGRAKAAERCGALRQYADYNEMLEKERPQLVCLASRWTNHRHAAGMAALLGGAHLYSEKPFTATLIEADELLATAEQNNGRIAVAHQMRLAPSTLHLRAAINEGVLGDLLEIRTWGKQDDRAGGEDMLVLGSHLFDLMRLFAGDALSCTARVLQSGRDVTRRDSRRVKEQIGPVAGDEVFAHFAFANGVNGTFTSRKRLRQSVGHWGVELIGSKTSARLLTDIDPALYILKPGSWEADGRTDQWQRLGSDPGLRLAADARGVEAANRRVVDDWLQAIEGRRQPACSGHEAMKSLEMIMAVYHSALAGSRVPIPLIERKHPLEVS